MLVSESNRIGVTARYISERSGLPLSTVYRWIDTLLGERLIVRHPRTRKLHLGDIAFMLGVQAVARPFVPPAVEEALQPLATSLGCRIHFVRRGGDYAVMQRTYFENLEMAQARRSRVAVMRLLGIGPAGLCLLAGLEDYELERFLVRNLKDLHAAGLDEVQIRARVWNTRTQGYAITNSALTPGFQALAVGLGLNGRAYSVSAAFPEKIGRPQFEKIRRALVAACQSIQDTAGQ